MDLLLPVFQLLYFVAHFLVSVCQAVYDTLLDVYNTACSIYLWLTSSHAKGLSVGSVGMSKLPVHPVLLLLPGQYTSSKHQLQQVAQIITALVQAGIAYISAYDAAGKLRDQQFSLKELIEAALPETEVRLVDDNRQSSEVYESNAETENRIPQEQDLRRRLHVNKPDGDFYSDTKCSENNSDFVTETTEKNKRGRCTPPVRHSVMLNVISFESGNSKLRSCVCQLAHAKDVQAVTVETMHLQFSALNSGVKVIGFESNDVVDPCARTAQLDCHRADTLTKQSCREQKDPEAINSNGGEGDRPTVLGNECAFDVMPDPDLVIVVGEYLSSNGFPAWFLRLTEFVLTPSLKRLDSNTLTKMLRRNAKIEQRYGR